MKKTILITLAIISIGCSTRNTTVSNNNDAVNQITNSTKNKQEGNLQKNLDSWLKDEWTPSVEKNVTIKKINEDKKRDFTLQEYVDKAAVYVKENNSSYENSHTNKINSMPVIGK